MAILPNSGTAGVRGLARAVALTALLTLGTAGADDDFPGGGGSRARCDACLIGLAAFAIALDVTFLTVDLVLIAQAGSLPVGWAVVELLLGGGQVIVGGILTPVGILGALLTDRCSGDLIAGGAALLAVGGFLVVHAIVSIVKAARRRASRADADRYRPSFALLPAPHGLAAALAWRF